MSAFKTPRKAVILAAGLGVRLQPLTPHTPKPLVPVWGKPVVVHVLELLRRWNVRDVLINLHHGAAPLFRFLATNPVPGLRIALSFEPVLMGTGGALRRADWFLDEPLVWVVNADVLADLPAEPLLESFRRHKPLAALWLHPALGPRTVEMNRHEISCLRSRRPGTAGTYTFCGLQLLSRDILCYLHDSESTLIDAYERALCAGRGIVGVTVPRSFWADIGTPESYRRAHADILKRFKAKAPGKTLFDPSCHLSQHALREQGVVIKGYLAAARDATIAKGAVVKNGVIWNGAVIGPRAVVRDAIIGTGVRIHGVAEHIALRADHMADPDVREIIHRLGWTSNATVVMPLPPRGSARSFTRLQCGRRTVMLIHYSTQRAENALYAAQARFLRRIGCHVPRVLLDLTDRSLTVVEDAGHTVLQHAVPHMSRARLIRLYERVLDDVLLLHGRGTALARRYHLALSPPFSEHLYLWEHNLFCEEFLQRHLNLRPLETDAVRKELRRLIEPLERAPQVLIHRDLQSSNILLRRGAPVLVDFQGMRFGVAEYDLASLLCDPYVRLSEDLVARLRGYYAGRSPNGGKSAALFWIAAVERLAQALGAYGRLGANPATARFLQYVPPAVNAMLGALRHLPGFPCLTNIMNSYRAPPSPGEPPCA